MRQVFSLIIIFGLASAHGAGAERPERTRKWTDDTGEFELRARMESVSDDGTSVILRRSNGRRVTIPIEGFSAPDRKYIASRMKKTNRPVAQVPTSASTLKAQPGGIQWYDDVGKARTVARGKATPQDDKPVMCFRVLGDLQGFM